MKDLKITKGEWYPDSNKQIVFSDQGEKDVVICEIDRPIHDCDNKTKEESENAAVLISDAGNTYQKCGLLPSELLKQRDELLEALKKLVHLHGCEQEGIGSGQPTPEQWYKAVEKAELIITKAEER